MTATKPLTKPLTEMNWEEIYAKLGINASFAKYPHRKSRTGSFWPVYLHEEITANKVVDTLKAAGVHVHSYATDLDGLFIEDLGLDEPSKKNGFYQSRLFEKDVEAGAQFNYFSAQQLEAMEVSGITLVERLLLELGYFLATGCHLDSKNQTICTGSHYVLRPYANSKKGVCGVRWVPEAQVLFIEWYAFNFRDETFRIREPK